MLARTTRMPARLHTRRYEPRVHMQTCTRAHTRGQRKAQEISSAGGGSEKSRSLELLSKIVAIDSATFDSAKAANKGLASVCPLVCPRLRAACMPCEVPGAP